MAKKGICVVTKNKAFAHKFKLTLEEKTNVRWADGALPTQIKIEYNLFFIENNPCAGKKILTGALWSDMLRDAETNIYGVFKELVKGEYDIYVL